MNRCSDRTNQVGLFDTPRRSGDDDITPYRKRGSTDMHAFVHYYNRESVEEVKHSSEAGCRNEEDYFAYRFSAWLSRDSTTEEWI